MLIASAALRDQKCILILSFGCAQPSSITIDTSSAERERKN